MKYQKAVMRITLGVTIGDSCEAMVVDAIRQVNREKLRVWHHEEDVAKWSIEKTEVEI